MKCRQATRLCRDPATPTGKSKKGSPVCVVPIINLYMQQKVYTNLNSSVPKRLSKLNHQTRFSRDYHSTYTFVKLLFILRHLASISPALPNLWLLLVQILNCIIALFCTGKSPRSAAFAPDTGSRENFPTHN